jgi:type III secretory pathway component EscV
MSSMTARSPAGLARHDLSAQQAIAVAVVGLGAVTALDLADGRLGFLFSLGFVLAVVTAPLSVDIRSLLPTGVMPPMLLIGALWVVALFFPDAIAVEGLPADAGALATTIAAVIDHGITLVVGHVLALAGIAVRVATAPTR